MARRASRRPVEVHLGKVEALALARAGQTGFATLQAVDERLGLALTPTAAKPALDLLWDQATVAPPDAVLVVELAPEAADALAVVADLGLEVMANLNMIQAPATAKSALEKLRIAINRRA